MSEEENKDILEEGGTPEQESLQVKSSEISSATPIVREDEVGDSAEVSKETSATELDSSKASSMASSPLLEGQEQREQESLKSVSPPSLESSPPPAGAVGGNLSDDAVNELNRLVRKMNLCRAQQGKLDLMRLFFREPGLTFYTKSETRRRRPAGRQTTCPTDSDRSKEASESESISHEIPMPILNQAGAVVGYTGPKPQKDPSNNENEPERSISSAETIPIEEAYMRSFFSPIFLPEENVDASSPTAISEERNPSPGKRSNRGFSEFDSSSGGARESPQADSTDSTDTRQRKLGVTQAVDIPGRPGSDPAQSGSFPGTRHPVFISRRYSLEFETFVPSRKMDQSVPKRKISQDSTGSDRHRPLSRESSVDLDVYMTSEPQGNETSTGNEELASADSPRPMPDLVLPPVEGEISDSTQASAMDPIQSPVPEDSTAAANDEGKSSESVETGPNP